MEPVKQIVEGTRNTNNDSPIAVALDPDLTPILACDEIATKYACTFTPISGYLDSGGELNSEWRYKIIYFSEGVDSTGAPLPKIRTGILSPRTPRAFQLAHEGKINRLVNGGVDPNIAKASLGVKYGQEFDVCYLASRILHHTDLPFVWSYLADKMVREERLYTRASLAYLKIDIGGISDLRCLSAIEIAFKTFTHNTQILPVELALTKEAIQYGRQIADKIGKGQR